MEIQTPLWRKRALVIVPLLLSTATYLHTRPPPASKPRREKVGVNRQFYSQIKRILPILFPSLFSREVGILVALAGILVIRTWLDIWFSAFNGRVVKAIVSRNRSQFVHYILYTFGLMVYISILKSRLSG